MKRAFLLLAALLATAAPVSAQTTYYLDPDVSSGTHVGTAANPWQTLNWTTINTALASNDVIVYFSAREAGSDTNEVSTTAIGVSRTDASTHRLTLSGNEKYNTNDSTPSWANYTGTSKFQISASIPFASAGGTTPRQYVTLHGFRLIASGAQIVYWFGGDGFTVEDCELSGGSNGIMYLSSQYESSTTCPTPRDGNESCGHFTGITFRRNYIHGTGGESIYMGGCYDLAGCTGHSNILIENNRIDSPTGSGGEPDCIDIKSGQTNVIVRGNYLTGCRHMAITTLSAALIEQNYLASNSIGIVLTEYYQSPGASRSGSIVRNNIIIDTGAMSNSNGDPNYGINLDYNGAAGVHFDNLTIDNNTVYKVAAPNSAGGGMTLRSAGLVLRNNIIAESSGTPLAISGASTHSNNLVHKDAGGTLVSAGSNYTAANLTTWEATALSTDPGFVSTAAPYAPANFRLAAISSPAYQSGADLSASFTTDYLNATRGATWDRGAWFYSPSPGPPAPTSYSIPSSATPRLQWDHAGINITAFKYSLDGAAAVTLGLPVPSGTTYLAPVPTMAAGSHTLTVQACSIDNLCTATAALIVVKF